MERFGGRLSFGRVSMERFGGRLSFGRASIGRLGERASVPRTGVALLGLFLVSRAPLPADSPFLEGGVKGRYPSLEFPRFPAVDGPRASRGEMAGG